jgi:hypothetical protein
VLVDRFEDMTAAESVRQDLLCDRRIALFGYLRGCSLKPGARMHLVGMGDVTLADVSVLPDPCPLPGTGRRSLDDRQRLLYAPMSDVGRLLYDKDAMYVNIADHTVNFTQPEEGGAAAQAVQTPGVQMVRGLQDAASTLNEKLRRSSIRIFARPGEGEGEEEEAEGGAEAEDESKGEEADEETLPPPPPRVRRPANFDTAPPLGDEPGEGDEDEAAAEEDEAESDSGESDDNELGGAAQWKATLGRQQAPTMDLMVRPALLPCAERLTLLCRRLCTARAQTAAPARRQPRRLTRRLRRMQRATETSCSAARRPRPAVPRSWTRATAPSATACRRRAGRSQTRSSLCATASSQATGRRRRRGRQRARRLWRRAMRTRLQRRTARAATRLRS